MSDLIIDLSIGALTALYGSAKGWGLTRIFLTAMTLSLIKSLGFLYLCQQ